jgi:hypothetical protein
MLLLPVTYREGQAVEHYQAELRRKVLSTCPLPMAKSGYEIPAAPVESIGHKVLVRYFIGTLRDRTTNHFINRKGDYLKS